MSEVNVLNTAKKYWDSEGNECSIFQMVSREPSWAASMVQKGEEAIKRAKELEEQGAKPMIIEKAEEWHEDDGNSMFIRFARDENGIILGEEPEITFATGYIQIGFNIEEWEYYVSGSQFNCWFEQAEKFESKAQ